VSVAANRFPAWISHIWRFRPHSEVMCYSSVAQTHNTGVKIDNEFIKYTQIFVCWLYKVFKREGYLLLMKLGSGRKRNCWLRDVEIPKLYRHYWKILCILFKAHLQALSVNIEEKHLTGSAQSVQWLLNGMDDWRFGVQFSSKPGALLRTDCGPSQRSVQRISVVHVAEVKRPEGEDGH